MRLPRDVSGSDLAKGLRRYGYEVVRQTGSHMRLVARLPSGEHHVTIPAHADLRVGTMRSVLGSVAPRVAVDVEPLIDSLVPAELEDLKRDIALGLAQLRRGDGVDGDGFFSRLAVHRRDADLPDAILMR